MVVIICVEAPESQAAPTDGQIQFTKDSRQYSDYMAKIGHTVKHVATGSLLQYSFEFCILLCRQIIQPISHYETIPCS